MKTNEETMAIFHIGRGGRFNNSGHLKFVGLGTIEDAERRLGDVFVRDEREDDEELLKTMRENGDDAEAVAEVEERLRAGNYRTPYYVDSCGNEVGEVGGGHYDFDGQYDTLYVSDLDDLSDAEKAAVCANSADAFGGGLSFFARCADQGTADELSTWLIHDGEIMAVFDEWLAEEGLDATEVMGDECELKRFAYSL